MGGDQLNGHTSCKGKGKGIVGGKWQGGAWQGMTVIRNANVAGTVMRVAIVHSQS